MTSKKNISTENAYVYDNLTHKKSTFFEAMTWHNLIR